MGFSFANIQVRYTSAMDAAAMDAMADIIAREYTLKRVTAPDEADAVTAIYHPEGAEWVSIVSGVFRKGRRLKSISGLPLSGDVSWFSPCSPEMRNVRSTGLSLRMPFPAKTGQGGSQWDSGNEPALVFSLYHAGLAIPRPFTTKENCVIM